MRSGKQTCGKYEIIKTSKWEELESFLVFSIMLIVTVQSGSMCI